MRLHSLLFNSNPVPIYHCPSFTLSPPNSQLSNRDITLFFTPGSSTPQSAAIHHLDSELLIIIFKQLHDFTTLWKIRRVCLEFFRIVMGDTKSNELFLSTLRRSMVPIFFLPTLGGGIRFHHDSRPIMMLMVNNYNTSIWSLFRMMNYNMLMNLLLYNEDIIFFTEDNNHELQQHPFSFPVLSLQKIIPQLGVTLNAEMNMLLNCDFNESEHMLQYKKEKIVHAIINAETWNAYDCIPGEFSGEWSHNLSYVTNEYYRRLQDWLEEPNNQILTNRTISHYDGRYRIRTHPDRYGLLQKRKTLYSTMQYEFSAFIDGDYPLPLYEFHIRNSEGCIESLLHFDSQCAMCLKQIGYLSSDLDAAVRNFVNHMTPDTTRETIEDSMKKRTAPGILHLYVPRQWTISRCYARRSMLFKILHRTYPSSLLEGSEILFMLKKLYNIQTDNHIWNEFMKSKQGDYAPDKRTTHVDNSRVGHRDKRMKKRLRGIFNDSRISSSSQLKQCT